MSGWRSSSFPEHVARQHLANKWPLTENLKMRPTILPRVCRLLYNETALYRLSASILSFDNESHVIGFLVMLLPIQRRAIRRIQCDSIRMWTQTRLKDMQGLDTVYVSSRRSYHEISPGICSLKVPDLSPRQAFWYPHGVKVARI